MSNNRYASTSTDSAGHYDDSPSSAIRKRRECSASPRTTHSQWTQETRSREPRTRQTGDEKLLATHITDLDQYREDFRAFKYAGLSAGDRMRLFGSYTMPIFVPLARGETVELYEKRFIRWLRRQSELLADELKAGMRASRERDFRVMFAKANLYAEDVFVAPSESHFHDSRKRQRDEELPEIVRELRTRKHMRFNEKGTPELPSAVRICAFQPPRESDMRNNTDTMRAHLVCGCTKCLFATMGQLEQQIITMETELTTKPTKVVDLTADDDGRRSH